MKTVSPALQTLLNSRVFWSCDLYILTLVGGGVYRWADGDCNVVDTDGAAYSCGGFTGPYFGRSGNRATITQKLGVQADSLTVDLLPGTSTIQGLAWGEAVAQGLFRGSRLEVRSAYAPLPLSAACWPVPLTGSLREFIGFSGGIDGSGSVLTLMVDDPRSRLQAKWPRNLYSPTCVEYVGSAGCGVDLTSSTVSGAVTGGSTMSILLTSLAGETGHYDLGSLTFTSGINQGLSRAVRSWLAGSPGVLTLMTPFPQAPAAGDAFTVIPGCDGSLAPQGCPKFGAGIEGRFRGCPFVPAPTTAN